MNDLTTCTIRNSLDFILERVKSPTNQRIFTMIPGCLLERCCYHFHDIGLFEIVEVRKRRKLGGSRAEHIITIDITPDGFDRMDTYKGMLEL